MPDPRPGALARLLLDHSLKLAAGETVLIEAIDLPDPALVTALVAGAAERGAHALVTLKDNRVLRALHLHASEEALRLAAGLERDRMERVDAYVGVRGARNGAELSEVPGDRLDLFQRLWWQPVHLGVRVPRTRWVVLRYPTPAMAQSAEMSEEAFEDFFFDVCTLDYARMAEAQRPLVARMEAADRVRVVAPGTELTFSIRGIPVRPCHGQRNIPDGEVFTAPVLDSVDGTIRFNTPSRHQGAVFNEIALTFAEGRVVQARSDQQEALDRILATDEGARRIGEWSLAMNNRLRRAMRDTLFDEKIGGSMHLALGQAYDDADNGNRSAIHWDIVLRQTPEHGGGEIWFDDTLIRKDGRFVPDDLARLNEGL